MGMPSVYYTKIWLVLSYTTYSDLQSSKASHHPYQGTMCLVHDANVEEAELFSALICV